MYTEKVMEHFTNPRNVGELENADAVGEVGNVSCGDIMKMYLKINSEEVIEDIKFKTFGCAAAIATSSVMTELVKGIKIEDALKVTKNDISEALGGLPPAKVHCSILATEALEEAVKNYRER